MDLTAQDVPVGFRSCICNTKRTSHVKDSLGIEVLRAWSRRHLLHSDGVLDIYHLPLPFGLTCFVYMISVGPSFCCKGFRMSGIDRSGVLFDIGHGNMRRIIVGIFKVA